VVSPVSEDDGARLSRLRHVVVTGRRCREPGARGEGEGSNYVRESARARGNRWWIVQKKKKGGCGCRSGFGCGCLCMCVTSDVTS
jgi:hypothetical protein